MANIQLVDTDQSTLVTDVPGGTIKAGDALIKKLGLKNNKSSGGLASVKVECFPGVKDNQVALPISGLQIVRRNQGGEMQVTSVAKEALTLSTAVMRTLREKVYRKTTGSLFVDYPDGTPITMLSTGETTYFGCNEIYFSYLCNVTTAGSYTSLTYEISRGSDTWLDITSLVTDGTNAFSVAGSNVITLPSSVGTSWAKDTINGLTMYWLRITCATCTTTAILGTASYWNLVFQLPKTCLLGVADNFYKRTTAPAFTLVSRPDKEYSNMARFAYITSPINAGAGDTLCVAYTYKNPQPDSYVFTFHHAQTSTWVASTSYASNSLVEPTTLNTYYYEVTAGGGGNSGSTEPTWPTTVGNTVVDGDLTWTCRQGTGVPLFCKINNEVPAISIVCNGSLRHYSVLPGCELVFSSGALVSNTVTVIISKDLEFFWLSLDGSSWSNQDLTVGNIAEAGTSAFWIKVCPHIGESGSDNERYIIIYARET